jgi:hypothetical protein
VYAADDLGTVYKIRLVVPVQMDPTITAWVSKKL